MRQILCAVTLCAAGLIPGPSVYAQCPTGIVTVQGKLDQLPRESTGADVTVVLKTPKGDFSKTVPTTGTQFGVEVDFNTLKSWSPVWGHRCSNLPSSVTVRVSNAGQRFTETVLDFKRYFEEHDAFRYRLRRSLTISPLTEPTRKP